ncbi:hypothetical protein AQUCO_00400644v1 [Aquilegia coerulea]|uniref:KIB1-4 beta-propeller domain-containing protein n=1 Tax=Aquilegia coerulea TaxID=218851 RepID=A0A2G5EW14_AQUCA|nr:hypothetical protein AQUCO_00400644v1 [Aquilegia coerulea]
MNMVAEWSQLPSDLCSSIGDKLDLAVDRVRFRSTCKTWRSSLHPPFPHPPWLFLSDFQDQIQSIDNCAQEIKTFNGEADECEDSQSETEEEIAQIQTEEERAVVSSMPLCSRPRGFVGVGDQRIYELDLPEAYQTHCVGSTAIHDGVRRLGIARPGDASWINVHSPHRSFEDIIIYKEKLYGVNIYGILMVCDNISAAFDDNHLDSPPKASILMDRFQLQKVDHTNKKYLVEWLGELLLVIKFIKDEDEYPCINPTYQTTSFKIYKLDFVNRKWDELKCLGDYTLFLGFNTSVSVLASDYSTWMKRNCIYFTDDYTFGYRGNCTKGGHDMGIFDLETNNIQPHYKGISTSFYSPPIWIIPTTPRKVPTMD